MRSCANELIRPVTLIAVFVGGCVLAFAQDYPCKIPGVNSVTCEKGQQAHCIPKGNETWDVECVTVTSTKNADQRLSDADATIQRSNARYSATDRFFASGPYRHQWSFCFPLIFPGRIKWKEEDEWRKKVQEKPDDEELHFRLGQILLENNKPQEAEKEIRFVVDRERPNIFRSNSAWPHAILWLGHTFFEQGRYAEAEDAFKRHLEIERAAIGHRMVMTTCSEYLLAMAQAARHSYADAENSIRKVGTGPDFASSILLLASVLYDQGKFSEAEVAYRKILPSIEAVPEPKDLTSLSSVIFLRMTAQEGLLAALLKQAKYADAAKLTGSLSIGRSPAWRVFEIGLLRLNQGNYIEAERILRQAVALDPTNLIFGETSEIARARR